MSKVLFIQPPKTVINKELNYRNSNILSESTDGFVRLTPSLPGMTVLGAINPEHEVHFLDSTSENPKNLVRYNDHVSLVGTSKEQLEEKVRKTNPDIILLTSLFTSEYFALNWVAEAIKNKFDTPIVAGGHHATLRPSWHLDTGNVDLVALGEGELNVNEILEYFSDKRSIKDTLGIAYLNNNGNLTINPSKGRLDNLDLPWKIKQVLFDENNESNYPLGLTIRNPSVYSPKGKGLETPSGVLYFSRGCWHDCKYCNATDRDGKKIRHMSLERMIELTKEFQSLGASTFQNESDTFGYHPTDREFFKWVAEQRNKGKQINLINTNAFFSGYFFPKGKFDSERVSLLERAGFKTITISIESFHEHYNNGKLRGISPEMLADAVRHIQKEGLKVDAYMMYLFPGQTLQELKKDVALAKSLKADTVTWRSLMYFPGTHYYRQAILQGKIDEKEYKKDLEKGWSFYHTNRKYNLSKIKNPPKL